MKISAQTLEQLSEATGLSRDTIRSTFGEIKSVLGDRLDAMRQRVSGIMANATHGGGDGGIDEVMNYADGNLSNADKSRIFAALGLGLFGGFLSASAAGSFAVLLVGLVLMIAAGMVLLSYGKVILKRLSDTLDLL